MEDPTRRVGVHELNRASRKAEDAALRRHQAAHWLDCLVGPLGTSGRPSERDFISCLRNGLVLCNVINKIQPGSVPKVVENNSTSQLLPWDSQPLPAYQYFENVRNFLVAVEELKLPVFEASVFERENLEEGSSAKVVDCILALKAFHEWKQMTGGNGFYKPPRSPLNTQSAGRIHARTSGSVTFHSSRQLDMSAGSDKPLPTDTEIKKVEDVIVKAFAEHMVDSKENVDSNLPASFRSGNVDSVKLLSNILSSCLEEQLQKKIPGLKSGLLDHLREINCSPVHSTSVPLGKLSNLENGKCCRACMKTGKCNHWNLVGQQERELLNLKMLLSSTKKEFESLQSHFQSDLKQIGYQVKEMSTAALGYHKVVEENRNLYNMVQDLKGNIRVYCRIRPIFNAEAKNVIDHIGDDGSLVVVDPLKPQKDKRKIFQFNHVFGPTATQYDVFRETRPLVRSVMDGYNVCIFAYGQTGSGKTHTMCGPAGGLANELGINYLAVNDLFQLSDERKDIIEYRFQVQMVEIYNEQFIWIQKQQTNSFYATQYTYIPSVDFLTTNKLEIRSCASDDSLVLPDATMCPVKSTTDVINLMKHGEGNRAVGSTAINNRSSRSHSVLTVHVHGEDVSGSILRSCLHLVDLAGSERVDKSEVTGDGLKEAQHINKSLACLGDVIAALAQKNSHIPYRNSKLTLLLQNALGGNAKTLMFAHVNPEGDSFGETMSTLKFAQRVSTVELGAARANKESAEVLELKAQIDNLKKALANKEIGTPLANKEIGTPLANKEIGTPLVNNSKEPARTPCEKPKQMTERTPVRPRRLSIENGSNLLLETKNYDGIRGSKTPSVKMRSRRSSLEGPSYVNKDSEQINLSEAVSKPVKPEITCLQNNSQTQEHKYSGGSLMDSAHHRAPRSPTSSAFKGNVVKVDATMKAPSFQNSKTPEPEVVSKPMKPEVKCLQNHSQTQEHKYSGGSLMDSTHHRAPRSPTSSTFKGHVVKVDTVMKAPSFQNPKTPEPHVKSRNGVQRSLQNDSSTYSEFQTPCSTSSTYGKGSQIRKSLRSIGKLINGSEKRNQQKSTEASMPFNGNSTMHDAKSPIHSNARGLRRQSLTGIQPSRRSSLGGASTDSYGNENRNVKTPPPVRASAKLTKRWL
ncbi:P-loop nucleoside triphosphate hydrolase superfamily protein with CH (Calponin-like proteiny) domain [Abeliophyllum distichum]|uniref:P-loop nucleoside triphosphate hydrolase superfamily protein with CH (Calponin-like proteiny) domain n=1 Tax=Abeliophyllum distichum TaxID=126358 RepID=A0ABD1QY33_9LAMI